ncbi:MAG: PQQ-binding-like beta-propeller repeat protein, partial [Candidatus Nealsonbacteria bacterium]|nr:PQQ-binding-like beta-propeller repeat protein [Candidatus Nealsonbacteria bacterium]
STVSIADGLLYVADVAGKLHCLDADTGEVHWVYDSKSRVIASTMVADGNIYLPTEKHLVILAAGKAMKLLSQISLGAPSWSTPVVANGTLYVSSKKYLWAVKQ